MPLTPEDRSALIALARGAVEAKVRRAAPPAPGELRGVLVEQRGCFVTLTNKGDLRGCIGTFHPQGPLAEMIVEMATAACEDPRFLRNPITARELPELTVEVSVLSPLEETAEPEKLQIGVHGIYIVSGYRAGCFLPEVATDMNWSAEQFLDYCCAHKAGLPPGAWKSPGTKVFLFTSEKFAE